MYEIRPESIKTFIEDSTIKLPRFQRKRTWDERKNFQLCISIFKEYPIGVTILNLEKNGSESTRWLLDGRQRRTALIELYKDPEKIYYWAKKFIGFKQNDTLSTLEKQFWEKIEIYLENNDIDEIDDTNNLEEVYEEEELNQENNLFETNTSLDNKSGLELLLYILKLIHNKKTRTTGFTEPFDFINIIKNLPYLTIINEKVKLSSQKLKSFINEYKNYCLNDYISYYEKENFLQFMNYRFSLDEKQIVDLEYTIDNSWHHIHERISMLEKIDNLFIESKIALIEVSNLNSIDSQKIFNIINSEGTKLTAVEILSAKPMWNIPIINPNELQLDKVKSLYKRIDIQQNDIVKWDLAATFISRLNSSSLFFKNFSNSKSDLSAEITLGFKFLSGYHEKGITKNDIEKLGKNREINWHIDYELLIKELNILINIILRSKYFKYLDSWNFSIASNLGDTISLNFLLMMYHDWKLKGSPSEDDIKCYEIQNNAFNLLDKLIYEYSTKQWRGASDSKVSQNLNLINNGYNYIKSIENDKWENLLLEILQNDLIQGMPLTQKNVQPILYHFYAISEIEGPGTDYAIEVDHIIPQSAFNSSNLKNKDSISNNLFNLALLPRGENISKGNKSLNEIKSKWLIQQIEKYEFISEENFKYYSNVTNINDLRNRRGQIFLNTLKEKRKEFLSTN